MKGYVARKGNRYYAVIYEGVDQLTGRERAAGIPPGSTRSRPRRWPPGSPASTTVAEAGNATA